MGGLSISTPRRGSIRLQQIWGEQSNHHRCTRCETVVPIVVAWWRGGGSKKSGAKDRGQILHFLTPVKIKGRMRDNAEQNDGVDTTAECAIYIC